MSLLRLLTSGKSLIGLQEAEGRYRLTSQRLLPSFGATRNPFGGSDKSPTAATEIQSQAEGGQAVDVPAEHRRSVSASQQPFAATTGVLSGGSSRPNAAPQDPPVPEWRRIGMLVGEWVAKAGSVFRRSPTAVVKPAATKFNRTAVQGELSLDRIKVVRNDLTDADLEVVQVRRSAGGVDPERRRQGTVGHSEAVACGGVEPVCHGARDK